MDRVWEHYKEALEHFSEDRIVGIFYQGSGNYGLDYEGSDVDTKLIVTPTFEDIAMNKKAVSTTHIRENEEHIDFKDIRLYMETFRKQNLNFLEILFTPYEIINPAYAAEWFRLYQAREQIARMNPWRAVKSMKGIALEKYHAMEHEYPSKMDVLAKYGYDPKQLHHAYRLLFMLDAMLNEDKSFGDAMVFDGATRDFLMHVKVNGVGDKLTAEDMMDNVMEQMQELYERVFDGKTPKYEYSVHGETLARVEALVVDVVCSSFR